MTSRNASADEKQQLKILWKDYIESVRQLSKDIQKEKKNQSNAKYHEENKTKVLEKKKRQYEENKTKVLENLWESGSDYSFVMRTHS